MQNIINLDPSDQLHVKGIKTGHSFAFVLDFTEDDNTPKAVPPSPRLTIYHDKAHTNVAKQLSLGAGLSVPEAHRLQVAQTRQENTMRPALYYFTITSDVDASNSFEAVNGTWEVLPGR